MSKIKQAMSKTRQAGFAPEFDDQNSSADAKPSAEYPADSRQSHRLSRTRASSSTIAMCACDALSFMPPALALKFILLNSNANNVSILEPFYLGTTRVTAPSRCNNLQEFGAG